MVENWAPITKVRVLLSIGILKKMFSSGQSLCVSRESRRQFIILWIYGVFRLMLMNLLVNELAL